MVQNLVSLAPDPPSPTPHPLYVKMSKSSDKKATGRRSDSPSLNLPGVRHSPRAISPLATTNNKPTSPHNSPTSRQFASQSSSPQRDNSPTSSMKSDTGSAKSKPPGLKTCPCNGSSEGKEWLLQCNNCRQCWHASCANLKGANKLSQPNIDCILKHWFCPWCYACSFPRPKSHKASEQEDKLAEHAISCSTVQLITESVSDAISKNLPSTIASQINQLSKDVQDLKNPAPYIRGPEYRPIPAPTSLTAPEPPYKSYQEEFLDEEELEKVTSFLRTSLEENKFAAENGHSVLAFGAQYHYLGSGSNSVPEAIPPLLTDIIQKMAAEPDLKLKGLPNSVLINYYPKCETDDEHSFLPYHSDNEPVIIPASDIATLSLGATRTISFKSLHDPQDANKTLEPSHNSIYTMSRTSQGWFKHGIENTKCTEDRFSITFRSVDVKYKRSVLILGDSNTDSIKFGSGAGKVGETYPGERKKAARIRDINPASCIGFSHLLIVCGTNDLRTEHVKCDSDIVKLVDLLRSKLTLIRQLSPSTKVTVVPVLPTRNVGMNKNIVYFNTLVDEMLSHCFRSVWFPSVRQFLIAKVCCHIN